MASQSGRQVDISQLPIPHLNQLSQQLDQEMEFFQTSLAQLKVAQGKFTESQECLSKLTPENAKQDLLVPLTTSMYVPGKLSDSQSVMVDIGTGYYVEKDLAGAQDYFKRKVEYVGKQMEKLQPLLQEKYKLKQAVAEILQLKVQAQLAAQQQGGGGNAVQAK